LKVIYLQGRYRRSPTGTAETFYVADHLRLFTDHASLCGLIFWG